MCKIFEDYGNEVKSERNLEIAERLLRQNKLSLAEISEVADVPLPQVEKLAEKISVTAMA